MKIFYREKGKGTPIVLIHGFCETHEIWNGFDDTLAENFHVLSIDLPGFGASSLPDTPFTIDDIAGLVLEWLKSKKILDPILIGHSLGGYVTLAIAAQEQTYSRNLVLFHSSVFSDAPEKRENRNKVIEFVRAHGVAPFIETFVPSLFYAKDHKMLQHIKSMCLKTPLDTLLAYTGAMRDRPDRQEVVINKIENLLIISGLQDEIIPPAIATKMASIKSGVQLIELPETGHMGMIESPALALDAIKKFANR
jgi:pimeloyl-ACP methyl ester carboxylesterase